MLKPVHELSQLSKKRHLGLPTRAWMGVTTRDMELDGADGVQLGYITVWRDMDLTG